MRLGILGGGQLGRMLALAAAPLGVRTRCLTESGASSASGVCATVAGQADDADVLAAFAAGLDAVTWESENVSAVALERLANLVPVLPGLRSLRVCADRVGEKHLFQRVGAITARWEPVDTAEQALAAAQRFDLPAVLKRRAGGYDGRGQRVIRDPREAGSAFHALGGVPCLLEQHVKFEREVSQLAVRARDGAMAFWPLTENCHRNGILRTSRARAGVDAGLHHEIRTLTERILEDLEHVGVLAVEFMIVDGKPHALEVAPRVHNSGHWTMDGSETSQFENHVRAVLGFPLGSTATHRPCAMVNLLGAVPERKRLLAIPGVRLHHYEKEAAPGRKLGHVNVIAPEAGELAARLAAVEALLES